MFKVKFNYLKIKSNGDLGEGVQLSIWRVQPGGWFHVEMAALCGWIMWFLLLFCSVSFKRSWKSGFLILSAVSPDLTISTTNSKFESLTQLCGWTGFSLRSFIGSPLAQTIAVGSPDFLVIASLLCLWISSWAVPRALLIRLTCFCPSPPYPPSSNFPVPLHSLWGLSLNQVATFWVGTR